MRSRAKVVRMLEGLEKFLMWMTSLAVGGDASAQCQLRAPINTHALVTGEGSLITFYRVVGSKRMIGEAQFESMSNALVANLGTLLRSGNRGQQHTMHFGFRSSPEGGVQLLRNVLGPSLATAKRFNADAEFLFSDRLKAMAPHCVDELSLFAVMTHPNGFSPDERKRWELYKSKQFAAFAKTGQVFDADITQVPHTPPPLLLSRHMAALELIEEKFSNDGVGISVMIDRLSVHEALRHLRNYLDADNQQPNWMPHLIGDKPVYIEAKRTSRTFDLGLPIAIGRQLITQRFEERFVDVELCKRGKMFYGAVVVDVLPYMTPTLGFSELFKAIGRTLPFQVHMELLPNGLDKVKAERTFASFMGAAGDHNMQIKKAFDTLVGMKNDGVTIAAMRIVLSTWAKTEAACVDNVSYLKSKVEGWGQCVATNETGAPAHAFMSSAPGYSSAIKAKFLPGPLDELARLLPLFTPASVWNSGQLTLFTADGRPYPIMLGSSLQNYWGTLVFAPTGSGKSFLMNMLNAGVLFTPGAMRLPLVTIVDKGESAKGVVRLAHAVLPPELGDQVVYWRPTPSDISYCMNPFDTQPGCDRPLDSDRDYLMALLGGMCSNLGDEGSKFLGKVIDTAYEKFNRTSPDAKRWQWSTDVELSEMLTSIGIDYSEEKPPRVWDVVDAFFAAGKVEESMRAQYYAMPLLGDLTRVVQDRRVLDLYGSAPSPTGEPLVKVFERSIIAAASEYKLFSGVTRHRATARFVVVDIDGMAAASTSEEGRRRFALTLLFARRLGARNYFLHPEDIRSVCPPMYLPYLLDKAQKNLEELKFLEYDEIHNAKGIGAVQNLLQKDAREGRKYNVVGILSSQDIDDFPPDLVKNCYNFFILGCGSSQSALELQKTFDLTDSERAALLQCNRPGVLFGMFRTNRGLLSQVLYTKPGSREIWAYNTSATDMALRNELYERYGVKPTLQFLSSRFPGGSARPYIEALKRDMSADLVSDDSMTNMIIAKLQPEIDAAMSQ